MVSGTASTPLSCFLRRFYILCSMVSSSYNIDRLQVQVTGPQEGEPVLVLHGWGSSAAVMAGLARSLSDPFRVFAVDLPGHGGSPPPSEPWGVPEHAQLVLRFIRERIGGPVTVVGHSNGGRIALYMASETDMAPLIRRLVLISPSGIPRRRTLKYRLRSGAAKWLKAPFERMPDPVRAFGLDWLRHSLVWKMLGSSDYAQLDGVMRDTFVRTVNFYVTDRLSRISAPTLLFWGDRDEAISREQMETLASGIPDAGLVELKGASHYGFLDDPDTVILATRHFLEHAPEETPAA